MKKSFCLLTVFLAWAWGESGGEIHLTTGVPYGLGTMVQMQKDQASRMETLEKKLREYELIKTKESAIEEQNRAILDALSKKVSDQEKEIGLLQQRLMNIELGNESNKTLSLCKEENSLTLKRVTENEIAVKAVLENLAKLLDETRQKIVTKEELEFEISELRLLMSGEISQASSEEKTNNWQNLPSNQIILQAQMEYKKGHYVPSLAKWEWLVKNDIQKPYALYMVGESQLGLKKYKEALNFYKQSYEKNPKGEYVDVLLLHTGYALEKLGDIKGAKTVYQTLLQSYPQTKSARSAKERIKTIK